LKKKTHKTTTNKTKHKTKKNNKTTTKEKLLAREGKIVTKLLNPHANTSRKQEGAKL
jgi:hypothetical protein